jgi:DNA-binding response OmpR family regulator
MEKISLAHWGALVVDVCFMLQEVLSEDGFVVDSYKDPLLALSNFKAHSYRQAIFDTRMPGLNGFALYREISSY